MGVLTSKKAKGEQIFHMSFDLRQFYEKVIG